MAVGVADATEDMLTIEPPPEDSMAAMPYLHPRKVPSPFTRSICRQSSSSPTSGVEGWGALPIPALLTRISRRPSRRSEEHTSELQSLMRISYAVFCLKKKKKTKNQRG